MRYRGRHRAVAPQQRRTRRLATVAALTASTLLAPLALTGPAVTHAGTGVPSVNVDTSRIPEVVTIVSNALSNCTASDGACTAAVDTAVAEVGRARACVGAAGSELGISQAGAAALNAVALDCGEVVRLALGLAEFAVRVVNDCTTEAMPLCQTVFDAARLGMDHAQGCLAAVLPTNALGVTGTDPGCASAMAMLYREAEGLIAILTGCLNGTDMACTLVREYAQFAVDGLTGCSGDLWRYYTRAEPPFPPGPLPCYAVLDQVNVAINSTLGQVPGLPTTITPTSDEDYCSVTVEAPVLYVDPDDPVGSQQINSPHDAHAFVPACYEPEFIQQSTDVTTPPLATGLEGPECENGTPHEEFFIDRTTGDAKRNLVHKVFTNVNGTVWEVDYTASVDTTYHAKITAGAETELKTWIGKIKATVEAEVGISRTVSETITSKAKVPPNTEFHVARKLFAKIVEGRHYEKTSDCRVKWEFRRIKAPYFDDWFKWEEPYNGDTP